MFAGRQLRLISVKDMTAYVRLSPSRKRGAVPRWQGGRLPLSVELADAVLELFADPESWACEPELVVAATLLDLQRRWSDLPGPDRLLIEHLKTREGHHLYLYPFCGRLANEGVAALVASRWNRSPAPGLARISGRITLTATVRLISLCSTSHTEPMPPCPSGRMGR